MANPTPGSIKEDAVGQLNKQLVQIVSTTILFEEYNRARKRFRNEHDWSWARKPTTLNFTAYGATGLFAAPLPADMHTKFDIAPFWTESSYPITWNKSSYRGLFTPGETTPRFYINHAEGKIISNCGVLTGVNADYPFAIPDLPLNTTQDTTAEAFPDGEPVTNLLIGYYWLATQRHMNKHDAFIEEYKEMRDELITRDMSNEPLEHSVELTTSVTR